MKTYSYGFVSIVFIFFMPSTYVLAQDGACYVSFDIDPKKSFVYTGPPSRFTENGVFSSMSCPDAEIYRESIFVSTGAELFAHLDSLAQLQAMFEDAKEKLNMAIDESRTRDERAALLREASEKLGATGTVIGCVTPTLPTDVAACAMSLGAMKLASDADIIEPEKIPSVVAEAQKIVGFLEGRIYEREVFSGAKLTEANRLYVSVFNNLCYSVRDNCLRD